jgi:hypothetical protein
MNQDRLARINEMAREHQLGELEIWHTHKTFKGYVMLSGKSL